MSEFETTTTVSVYVCPEYHYEVDVGPDDIAVRYKEHIGTDHRQTVTVSFGSYDEMEAVAKAMLRAVEIQKGN